MDDAPIAKQPRMTRILVLIWVFVKQNVLMQVLSAILGLIIVERVTNWWMGPQSYRVYVVGSFEPFQETTQEVWQAFSGKRKPSRDDRRWGRHRGRPKKTRETRWGQPVCCQLAGRSDTLMVWSWLTARVQNSVRQDDSVDSMASSSWRGRFEVARDQSS